MNYPRIMPTACGSGSGKSEYAEELAVGMKNKYGTENYII